MTEEEQRAALNDPWRGHNSPLAYARPVKPMTAAEKEHLAALNADRHDQDRRLPIGNGGRHVQPVFYD